MVTLSRVLILSVIAAFATTGATLAQNAPPPTTNRGSKTAAVVGTAAVAAASADKRPRAATRTSQG